MPRPNRIRSVEGETNLARRIQRERNLRGWSYETLASKMTEAGCPIQGSAIYKVEKGGEKRRRVTVDELIALAQVFDVTVENLLTPVEVLRTQRGQEVLKEIEAGEEKLHDAVVMLVNAWTEYWDLAAYEPDLKEYVDGHRITPGTMAAETVEAMPRLIASIEVEGEAVPANVDDTPVFKGLEALLLGIIEVSSDVAMLAIDEHKRRGIGSSPISEQESD